MVVIALSDTCRLREAHQWGERLIERALTRGHITDHAVLQALTAAVCLELGIMDDCGKAGGGVPATLPGRSLAVPRTVERGPLRRSSRRTGHGRTTRAKPGRRRPRHP